LIVTGDQDILQLVDDNIRVQLPDNRTGSETKIYDYDAVVEKLGVRPNQIVDYKALVGDTSDNIPGVAGIGPKTPVRLLEQYSTLEVANVHIDGQTRRMLAKLGEGREHAFLSQKLAGIQLDAPIQIDLAACVAEEDEAETVVELFRELEFRSLALRFV